MKELSNQFVYLLSLRECLYLIQAEDHVQGQAFLTGDEAGREGVTDGSLGAPATETGLQLGTWDMQPRKQGLTVPQKVEALIRKGLR